MVGHVRADDARVEVVGEVEDVVHDAELLGDPAGVLDVAHRAAARVTRAAPELHGGAHDVVTLLQQQRGRDRGVDATGHGDEDLHARRRATASATTEAARSTSASVVVAPSDRRSAPLASSAGTPIAEST